MKEIQSIIDEVCDKQPEYSQPLERLRILTMDKTAAALADGYMSGIDDVILMLQDYMKSEKDGKTLREQLKEQALNAAQTNAELQRTNGNTRKSK
tara:strand:+ start:3580 stop:3864 length:285 start_codon:yes stop_codon:yes gene_type:complete